MKKIVFIFLILLFFLILLLASPLISSLQEDCPYGETNCEYPGNCNRYLDTNTDGLCDHSQTEPITQIPITKNTLVQERYPFLWLSIILIGLYLLTFSLSKLNKIKIITHRKIWNTVLLLSFLTSGILGLLLVIRINFGTDFEIPKMLFIHVETGIILAWTSIFHIIWHWRYYKNLFNK